MDFFLFQKSCKRALLSFWITILAMATIFALAGMTASTIVGPEISNILRGEDDSLKPQTVMYATIAMYVANGFLVTVEIIAYSLNIIDANKLLEKICRGEETRNLTVTEKIKSLKFCAIVIVSMVFFQAITTILEIAFLTLFIWIARIIYIFFYFRYKKCVLITKYVGPVKSKRCNREEEF